MNPILSTALGVLLGTVPLLGMLAWNMVEVKEIRKELSLIRTELSKITERVAILEERDRMTHSLVKK